MKYSELSQAELVELKRSVEGKVENLKAEGLSLNMARGKPAPKQIELSYEMLNVLGKDDLISEDGTSVANYGGLSGTSECKKLFADYLSLDEKNIIVGGSSSLNLMFDFISQCYNSGIGGEKPWREQGNVKFIANVPGYDRHFGICEYFGIEMINVPLLKSGPDVKKISELIKDPLVKGMFCVPKYSNPTGQTYTDDTVRALSKLAPAAKDFRVIWDNAYLIHDFNDTPDTLLNIFEAAEENGTKDLFVEFCSTSKITFPGAGVSAIGASDNNIKDILFRMKSQTIGFDKINMQRHIKFFKDMNGIKAHMKKHSEIIRPKFEAVLEGFKRELSGLGIAEWTSPNGGYFISLDVLIGSAKRVGEICNMLGVGLTAVGATFPYGKDPEDKNIRIAPTYPTAEEMAKATEVLCVAVKLAALEELIK